MSGLEPEWWDLQSGAVRPAEVLGRTADTTTVAVDLPAYGSTALVFSGRQLPAPSAPAAAGPLPAPLDLSGGWTVTFGPDARPVSDMDQLKSWTDDPATRNFSGVAVYEKTIDVPADLVRPGLALSLEFGPTRPIARPTGRGGFRFQALVDAPVREAAVVTVNGQRAGSVWSPRTPST